MTIPPIPLILMIVASFTAQIAGLFLMPMTKGVTVFWPTVGAAIAFLTGFGLMARIAASGFGIGLVIPFFSALVPIGAIAIGILAYGETPSVARMTALLIACVLIGLSNFI